MTPVGTWGVGPFDNDTALDWRDDLDEAPPADRVQLVRAALEAADDEGYLDYDVAAEAVAAAAVVASDPALPTELRPLAVRALDRVIGPDSEWRQLWSESDELPDALAGVRQLRATLES